MLIGFFYEQGQLIANDKMEKERADARNAVEEYVYEMRGKVHDALGDFFAEADRLVANSLV
jgi:KaiC/GvpD/RAD55 family RecA-like ATPase